MGRLFFLFFMLPWWAYIPAAIGVYWVGERAYEQALETEAERKTALDMAAPQAIDIGNFDRDRDIHTADEINVIGLIDHDLDYELVEYTNGIPTTTRYLYMIFGAEQFGSGVVRGALMLDKRDEALFLESMADEWAVDATSEYWVYAFNGFAERTAKLDDMVDDAIAEQGLTKADDFIFIDPFFEGRQAALSATSESDQTRQIFWVIAGVVALIGVFKRVMSVRARPAPGEAQATGLKSQEELAAYIPPPPEDEDMASGFAVPEGVSDDTPLGRLARKSRALQTEEEPLRYTAYGAAEPEEDEGYAHADDSYEAAEFEEPDYESGVRFEEPDDETYTYQDAGYAPAGVAPRPQSSAGAFYAKLALAMVLVGALAYDPSLLNAALPFAVIGLIWFGLFSVFRKLRGGAKRAAAAVAKTPRHRRRPDAGAEPLTAGAMDIGSPVQSSRRERGVI